MVPPESHPPVSEVLRRGELELTSQIIDGQNQVFSATAELDERVVRCVYKPVRGERPLWDFPDGTLAERERAAYLISETANWGIVPVTVLRDGPLGRGSCQLWVDHSGDSSLVDVLPAEEVPSDWLPILSGVESTGQRVVLAHANDDQLANVALFDAVINNGDRKAGHLLVGETGQLRGIDHGVTFHPTPKLRTVLWGWAGQELSPANLHALAVLANALDSTLNSELAAHLTPEECDALHQRVRLLTQEGKFPEPSRDWPPIPYPLW